MCLPESSGNFHYMHEGIVILPVQEKVITTISIFGRDKTELLSISGLKVNCLELSQYWIDIVKGDVTHPRDGLQHTIIYTSMTLFPVMAVRSGDPRTHTLVLLEYLNVKVRMSSVVVRSNPVQNEMLVEPGELHL